MADKHALKARRLDAKAKRLDDKGKPANYARVRRIERRADKAAGKAGR
jgi:hypothetical protein